MPFYPGLPSPIAPGPGPIAQLAGGAAVGQGIANTNLKNQALQQGIQFQQQRQKALSQFGQTGDAGALMQVDPEAAVKVLAEQRKAAGEWFDQSKWMVKDKPDNYGTWRQQAIKMFGQMAESYIPKEYPGPEWFTKHEDYVAESKRKMSEAQAKDLDIKQRKYESTAAYQDRLARVREGHLGLDAVKTEALISKYGAEKERAEAQTGKIKSETGQRENYNAFAEALRAKNPNITEDAIVMQWNDRYKRRHTPGAKGKSNPFERMMSGEPLGGGGTSKAPGAKNFMTVTPDGHEASKYNGYTITVNETGEKYKSNGVQWVKQ